MDYLKALLCGAVLISLVRDSSSFKNYQLNLPNGNNVPHPCKPNYIWQGVGHKNPLGSGVNNPFGLDFAAEGHEWTVALCQKDSDQDGKSNGIELGDPNCVWAKNDAAPEKNSGLSHPGVCEPVDSDECKGKNDWEIDCTLGEYFDCPAINSSDVKNFTLLFDRTKVPAVETTYMCQAFDIPDIDPNTTFHMIAATPVINNYDVMHHTLVYGCKGQTDEYDVPSLCGMTVEENCVLFEGWTVGSAGTCTPDNIGSLFRKDMYDYIVIQHHWNNPQKLDTYFDSSGMTFYYTDQLRQYNASGGFTGQTNLIIPPNTEEVTHTSVCNTDCIEPALNGTAFIYSALLHMHYLGRSGTLELWRNGKLEKTILNEEEYSYDFPRSHSFDPPIELLPGDELKTICRFSSRSKSTWTYYGDATSDEMCFVFIDSYPHNTGIGECLSYGDYDNCVAKNRSEAEKVEPLVWYSTNEVWRNHIEIVTKECTVDCKGVSCQEAFTSLPENSKSLIESAALDIASQYKLIPSDYITTVKSCMADVDSSGTIAGLSIKLIVILLAFFFAVI